ncbi:zinc finger and BTB domain-containing protein 44-like isoform X3 [Cataglyphis hispanica]|uniref:zinc finger and BTB domain-containing protein 44-like isoform X3 n=1 Tax=Cataglyphis hispanica TaxID=1086592 RepID=UPI00217FF46D|nr:zinc finger and BTB domain-containing protein 44-like isoform X3 [Cataglyphis hispanica]
MSDEQFSLVWNSFPRNLSSGLYTLLTDEQLVDVTLAAEGQILRAHKLILSVCSTYFRELFKVNSCKHPIVILKDVNYRDLSAMLHFMYQGEVNIKQEDIASFLKVAETLQIKGLTTESDEKLEDTLRRNVEDFEDRFFDVERHKSDLPITNETNVSTIGRLSHHITEKEQSTAIRRNTATENLTGEVRQFTEQTSSITCHQHGCMEGDYNLPDKLTAFSETCKIEGVPDKMEESPLDCTSDVNQPQEAKHEPLDYRMDTDTEARYKSYTAEKILYNSEENTQQKQADFNNVTAFRGDFTYDTANASSKGRRTVKGIPGSSLPLETTLRVISELGPTLRMERGKVIRMYACPWCLRHFTRKENLKLHVRYIHGPLESLTCKLCGNKYKNSNSLRVHSYLYHNAKRDKQPSKSAGGDDGGDA